MRGADIAYLEFFFYDPPMTLAPPEKVACENCCNCIKRGCGQYAESKRTEREDDLMSGKETKKTGIDWKKIGGSLMGTLGIYLMLQFLGAALVSGEMVGEERMEMLIGVSACAASLVSPLIALRHERSRRLVLCLASGGGFLVLVVLIALAGGSWEAIVRGIWVLLPAVLAGSALAALLGGTGKKKGHSARRR